MNQKNLGITLKATLISLKESPELLRSVDKNYFSYARSVKKYCFEKIAFNDPERTHLPRVLSVRQRL